MTKTLSHQEYMQRAIELARSVQGQVFPNPAVGCVIVKNGEIISEAATSPSGRPHAEYNAVHNAKSSVKGATAYVSLEPCAHYGKTPPCADLIIESGIKTVVVASSDPFEKVNGKGVKKLKDAGIEVIEEVCEEEARIINKGFFKVQKLGMPNITLKIASSMDGKIALSNGKSKWITSSKTREYGHLLRYRNDAVMVGIGTVIADDPMLNCRLENCDNNIGCRVIIDSKARLPIDSKLAKTAKEYRTILVTNAQQDLSHYEEMGIEIIRCETQNNNVDMKQALSKLAELGITSILVEGGTQIYTSLLQGDLVDDIYWMRAPIILGGDAYSSIDVLEIDSLGDAKKFKRTNLFEIDNDVVEVISKINE